MAALDWHLTRTGETTLVELLVTTDQRRRVEIASDLRPVWPPRSRGRPESGWNGPHYEGIVAPDDRLVIGYASPADPVNPPARIVSSELVSGAEGEAPPSPDELVQALGRAEPPRDAIPPGPNSSSGPYETRNPTDGIPPREEPGETVANPSQDDVAESVSESPQTDIPDNGVSSSSNPPSANGRRTAGSNVAPESDSAEPEASPVRDEGDPGRYLEAVSRRVAAAGRLSAADTVVEARAAVDAAGGMDAVRTLESRLATDRAQLQAIEEARAELEEQLATLDIPVSALERLV